MPFENALTPPSEQHSWRAFLQCELKEPTVFVTACVIKRICVGLCAGQGSHCLARHRDYRKVCHVDQWGWPLATQMGAWRTQYLPTGSEWPASPLSVRGVPGQWRERTGNYGQMSDDGWKAILPAVLPAGLCGLGGSTAGPDADVPALVLRPPRRVSQPRCAWRRAAIHQGWQRPCPFIT